MPSLMLWKERKRTPVLTPSLRKPTTAQDHRRLDAMQKLLVIDDEEPMRRLLRVNLSDSYEIIDTGDPEQGLALAMQNTPSAIVLDLRMPRFSGFELCRTFTALTSTQLTPVFIVRRRSRVDHQVALQGAWSYGVFR